MNEKTGRTWILSHHELGHISKTGEDNDNDHDKAWQMDVLLIRAYAITYIILIICNFCEDLSKYFWD